MFWFILIRMCGRFRLNATERQIAEHFNLDSEPQWSPAL